MTWLKRFLSRHHPDGSARFEAERGEVERHVSPLYQDNLQTLVGSDPSIAPIIGSPDYETLKDLFLLGMIGACITERAPLARDPCDGLVPHLVRSLVDGEGLSRHEAQARAAEACAALEAGHPVLDGFVEAGGLALRTGRTDCLLLAHDRLPSHLFRD